MAECNSTSSLTTWGRFMESTDAAVRANQPGQRREGGSRLRCKMQQNISADAAGEKRRPDAAVSGAFVFRSKLLESS